MINKKSNIFVTGHKGLVGSAVVRRLNYFGYKNILTADKKKLDLRNQSRVFNFFKKNKIDAVINAAAKVGGIYANDKYKADFIYENLEIQNNVIYACFKNQIKSLIFLGSSCIYPKNSKQPIKEKYLLTGELEKTNEPYAIAKIAGIKMCESFNFQYKTNYKCLMPCNLYGPNDNYDPITSHFFPALIAKAILAKTKKKKIKLWGSGKPKRELMYVDDLADACIYFLKKKTKETLINVGSGYDMSILDYAKFIRKKMNLNCKIAFDSKRKYDGTFKKTMDISVSRSYGWSPKIDLSTGLELTLSSLLKIK